MQGLAPALPPRVGYTVYTLLIGVDMAQMWIDEQWEFGLGDSAFLLSVFNENTASTRFVLRNQPPYTNNSNEPKLHGWCGSYNNLATYGEGAVKVIRIAKSGRYLVESLEGQELEEFLDDMGYPGLDKEK